MFKRGDLVICSIRLGINTISTNPFWIMGEVTGVVLLLKKTRNTNMYLVNLDDGRQRYFYEDSIKLDKIKIRENILNNLGI